MEKYELLNPEELQERVYIALKREFGEEFLKYVDTSRKSGKLVCKVNRLIGCEICSMRGFGTYHAKVPCLMAFISIFFEEYGKNRKTNTETQVEPSECQ